MKSITEVTRRNIIDSLLLRKIPFHGRLDIIEFLKRIWDLSTMPSSDIRYKNAEGDLWQHVINNSDYDYDYLLYKYFDLLNCDDDTFLKFLEVCLHPIVLTDEKQVSETLSEFNNFLTSDGFKLEVSSQISRRPVYTAIRFKSEEEFISTSTDIKKVKKVIPITQSTEDIPFDLRHHRFLFYLNNNEGLLKLKRDIELKLKALIQQSKT